MMGKHRGEVPGRRDHTGWVVMAVALGVGLGCVAVGFASCMGFLLA